MEVTLAETMGSSGMMEVTLAETRGSSGMEVRLAETMGSSGMMEVMLAAATVAQLAALHLAPGAQLQELPGLGELPGTEVFLSSPVAPGPSATASSACHLEPRRDT